MKRFSFVLVSGWLISSIGGNLAYAQGRVEVDPVLIDKFLVPLEDFGSPLPCSGLPGVSLQSAEAYAEEPLPADAQAQLKTLDDDVAAIQKKADEEKRQRRVQAIAALQELQDRYTREAKLDEAVAIRDRIRRLKRGDLAIFRDPGALYHFQNQIGKSFLFEVVGSVEGSIWGSEVYTGDSRLAKAAVHMGILKPGQKGIVKATIIASPAEHQSSTQNGITSSSFGSYSFSYTVEPFREP